MMDSPIVSICCLTYNHRPFIEKCLDGFLMQKTTFSVEILIHDDCSTDGTTEIVKEYAAKYPDFIFPLYEDVNQYSRGGSGKMDLYNYKRVRGKYIAYCEGDDYWTDPLKLQKQVDWMEANPEYSVCWHNCSKYAVDADKFTEPAEGLDDYDVSPEDFLNGKGGGQPLTMIFRFDNYDFDWRGHYTIFLDTMEIFHLLRTGMGRFMQFNGGQYNMHQGGICTSMKDLYRGKENFRDFSEMYNYTKEKYLLPLIKKNALWFYRLCFENKDYSYVKECLGYMYKISALTGMYYSFLFVNKWLKWKLR